MSGGTYTLNGSVNIITGQGQDGVYTLNSSGDDIITQNSNGGVYTLYPGSNTTNPTSPAVSNNQTLSATIMSVIFGGESTAITATTTAIRTPAYIENPNTFSPQYTSPQKTYRDYQYTDTVQFGRGISTYPEERGMGVPYINWLLIKIIIIGLLILLLKLWNDYRKSL